MEKMQTLYLKGWEYNSYLIMNELYKIIKQKGGFIVYDFPFINTYKNKKIINRSILEEIDHDKNILKGKTKKEIKENTYFLKISEDLSELEKINNKPVKIYIENYINFILNDFVYYIQIDNNPFFEDYIQKAKIDKKTKNEYLTKYNYYMEEMQKTWFEKENIKSFYLTLTKKQIKKLANNLFEQIINSKESDIVTNKQRFYNTFDNRYHYEYVKEIRPKKYKIIEEDQ